MFEFSLLEAMIVLFPETFFIAVKNQDHREKNANNAPKRLVSEG